VPTRTFRINGSVTDTQTKKGISGLRVEVWNSPSDQHSVLGSAMTDAQGQFDIAAVADVPATPATGGATGVVPATLRVFQDTQSLAISGKPDIPDLFKFRGPAVLQVQPSAPQQQLQDRITTAQARQAIAFVQKSDFLGVFREGRNRVSSVGSLLTSSLKSAAKSFSLQPLQAPQVRHTDIVNQDTLTATRRLNQQQVNVTSVQQFQPGIGNLSDVTSLAANVKPGDNVELYQQNGIVTSFKVIKPATTTDTTQLTKDVANLQGEVGTLQTKTGQIDQLQIEQQQQVETITALQQKAAKVDDLQTQLAKVQADSAQKDQTISKLQTDLATVTKAHAQLAAQITPERLSAIEDALKKLQKPK